MIGIDQLAFNSKLRGVAPSEKMFFAILTLVVCLFANNILVPSIIFMTMGYLTIAKSGVDAKVYLRLILLPFLFLIIGVITIAVGIEREALNLLFPIKIFGWFVGISKTGIITAVLLFFKSLGAISCLYFLSLTTPMTDVLIVAGKLKIPPLILDLMSLVYKFLFILMDTGAKMFTAQNSRLGYKDSKTSFKSMGALGATLFIRAYKRADRIYTAMEARGYDGEIRVLEEEKIRNRKNYFFAIVYNVILIILIVMG